MKYSNIRASDLDFISINRNNNSNFFEKIKYSLLRTPNLKLIFERIKNRKLWSNTEILMKKNFPNDVFKGKIVNIEHHLAHLSSAFHLSPFEQSCIISVDGFGDFASTVLGFGINEKIEVDKKVLFPHSLGIFMKQ